MKGKLSRTPSVASNAYKRSDLRLLLGVLGAPLSPVQVSANDPLPHLCIKDTPIAIKVLNMIKLDRKPIRVNKVKRATPRIIRTEMVAVRRSNRVANKPAPLYTQIITYERLELPRRNLKNGMYKRRDLSNRVYASDEARELAISKAQEVESGLGGDYPTFLKPMTQSHVTGGFWLGLPVDFCRRNLPRRDETVTLVDEEGEEYPTVYLARKAGLSGGWRGFSIDHGLVDGDAIVFQLIRPTVFKVHIIRANSFKEGNKDL